MKIKTKSLIKLNVICLLLALLIARIIYVNTIIFTVPKVNTGKVGESITWNECELTVTDYNIYSAGELIELYQADIGDYVDDFNFLIDITITNCSNEEKIINAMGYGIMYGYVYGGNPNSNLFYLFNPTSAGTFELNPGQSKCFTLSFPCEKDVADAELIFSIYPEKCKVDLI